MAVCRRIEYELSLEQHHTKCTPASACGNGCKSRSNRKVYIEIFLNKITLTNPRTFIFHPRRHYFKSALITECANIIQRHCGFPVSMV